MTRPAAFHEVIKIIVRFQLHGQMIFGAFNTICNISAQNTTFGVRECRCSCWCIKGESVLHYFYIRAQQTLWFV